MKQIPVFLLAMALLIGLALVQLIWPAKEHSDIENRPLAQLQAPSLSAIRTGRWMKDAEDYVADQFPGRAQWMNLQAVWDTALLRTERNSILLGKNGWMFEKTDHLALRTAGQNAQAIGSLAGFVDVPVSMMLVPMSSAVYPQLLPRWYEPDDQSAIMDGLYAQAGGAEAIDVLGRMRADDTRDMLYFQTDHHWSLAGAMHGYDALAQAWSLEKQDWPSEHIGRAGFYGTYFSRAPYPLATGDTLMFDATEHIKLTVNGEDKPGLYSPEQMAARDKYAALLWGNHGHITLESPAQGGALLVIKDSYANMLLPKLAQHFSRIEAIDLRYFTGDLAALLQETEAERILCLYGLTTFLTDRNLLLHSAAWEN